MRSRTRHGPMRDLARPLVADHEDAAQVCEVAPELATPDPDRSEPLVDRLHLVGDIDSIRLGAALAAAAAAAARSPQIRPTVYLKSQQTPLRSHFRHDVAPKLAGGWRSLPLLNRRPRTTLSAHGLRTGSQPCSFGVEVVTSRQTRG